VTNAAIDVDRTAREQREKRVAQVGNGTAPHGSFSRRREKGRDQQRWATLNTFVDVIAPRLTLAERAVWLVMFRHARDGIVQTSERQLSTAARIDKATAGKALRQLVKLKLAWVMMKSASKESTSRYGLHPSPSVCLPAVIAEDDRRRSEADERRKRNGGDRRGRRKQEPRTG
jgi:hypothetical protein